MQQMVKSKIKSNLTFEERRQTAWDQIMERYEEEGIPVCSGEFKINYFTAVMMTAQAITHDTGTYCKLSWVHVEDLIDREVYPGIFIDKRGPSYYLMYEDCEIMTKFIEDYLLLNKRNVGGDYE